MCIAEVEVRLDEVLVDLENGLARQNDLLNSSVDSEGKLVRTKQFRTHLYAIHSHQYSVAKPC